MTTPSETYRTITLSNGQLALVDQSDFEWLSTFRWYATWNPFTKSFYAKRRSLPHEGSQHQISMHRMILELGFRDKRQGDHRNHNTLDNRRGNLRVATTAQNQHNRAKQKNNTSGFKGVCWHKKTQKWTAAIRFERKLIYLGVFVTIEEARDAWIKAAQQHHGEFFCPS